MQIANAQRRLGERAAAGDVTIVVPGVTFGAAVAGARVGRKRAPCGASKPAGAKAAKPKKAKPRKSADRSNPRGAARAKK